jgi:hypothetical protein
MGRVSKYPEELRDRAVRMVAEVRPQYPSQWAAIDRRPQAHTNSCSCGLSPAVHLPSVG